MPPHKRYNTSLEYKEHKPREDAIMYLQANKTLITSIQGLEELLRSTSVYEIHLHTITTSRKNIRKPFPLV
jgi:hypothetical protein